jgi:UDP-N-acetylmuramoylalanine--D-glutamate ligase
MCAHATQLVLSPGVALQDPVIETAMRRGAKVLGDIELFARDLGVGERHPVVAITGTNGKSTVTTLVGEMAERAGLSVKVGGNLGIPALDLLEGSTPNLYVLELSSFQLESTRSLQPLAATVLNLSPDHMDRYPALADYAGAKARIFRGAGTMVLNLEDPWVAAMAESGRRTLGFRLGPPGSDEFGLVEVGGEQWLARGRERLMPVSALLVTGLHNVANVLAALALGTAVDLPIEAMVAALRKFRGLSHRCEWVAETDGVDWYNDSKGTNVGAACAAIRGLGASRPLVLIAGGDGKGADFGALAEAAAGAVRAAVVLGRDGPRVARALGRLMPVVAAQDMPDAVARAAELAQRGDAVLLSPACASLDMFRDYADRGRVYAAAVQERTRR